MEVLFFEPTDSDVRVEFGMAEAEIARHAQWRASATMIRAIEITLREAAAHPAVFVPSATLTKAEAT